jgi:hypothetical protein
MPNRFAVLPTDFALNPQVRAAGHRAGWTWFLVATAATICTPPADTAPRLHGAGQWANASWRCLGVSRRDVYRAVACGLLRWDGDDLIILGMGTRFDSAEAEAAPRSPVLIPSGGVPAGGMSAAARDQRRAAIQARWAKQRAEADQEPRREPVADTETNTGRIQIDTEMDTESDTEMDTGRTDSAYGPYAPSLSLPSQRQDTEPEKTGDRARPPVGTGDTGEDTERIRAVSISVSDSVSISVSDSVSPSVSDRVPIPATAKKEWATVRHESWVGLLLHAGAKCGPKNWPLWKELCDGFGAERVVEVARSIEAQVRWPDRVEDALKRLGSQRPTGAAIAHKVIRVQV